MHSNEGQANSLENPSRRGFSQAALTASAAGVISQAAFSHSPWRSRRAP
jgi:hypothetical protein